VPARYEPRQRNEPNLRHARAQAGYRSQDALANALDTDRTVIAKAETGERPPNDTLLNAWLDKCEVTGLARAAVEGECRLTQSKEGPVKVWVAPWFETEAKAHTLRYWAPVIVPGLAKLLPPVGPP
jgi:DNA-binding XRE family transcriptional regulator